MSDKQYQNQIINNPFKKKQTLFEKPINNGPIEQVLILHHKRNLRKSMKHQTKLELEKEQKQNEKENNENSKRYEIINGKKVWKFKNILLKKGEYFNNEEKQNEQNNKNDKECDKGLKGYNPFINCISKKILEIKRENDEKNEINNANNKIENPFKMINETFNPFKVLDNSKINKTNPFMNIIQDNNNNSINSNNNNKNFNPFRNIEKTSSHCNPFLNNNINNNLNKSTNPFLNAVDNTNKEISSNPFLNNEVSNIFTFDTNNLKNNPSLEEDQKEPSDDEDDKKIEEEIKIEKDENKLKNLKEVQYQQSDKFYETEIENLQFLMNEDGKNKYISKGNGIFCFQQEKNEQGKNVGIFTLREKSTKNIKLQGIVIDNTTVEKSKLKNGLEFIFIKNIIVKYTKYDKDNLIDETKISFLRIRILKDEIDNFYNKTNEFFNLVKNKK